MNPKKICNFSEDFCQNLLGWYHKNKRALPWRAVNQDSINPYYTWLSEIMLQQTTVPTVIPYFLKFIELYPSIHDLAQASEEEVMREWAGLGYYARARNLIKCAKAVVSEHDGIIPDNLQTLKNLPGIGDYTAAAIMAIAFDKHANVVDGNVERVVSRIFKIETPLPKAKSEIKDKALGLMSELDHGYGDYAQGLMDLGSSICTPKNSKCAICPVNEFCMAFKNNKAEDYPKKAPKKAKPKRYGHIFWIEDSQGMVLYDKRPKNGLLGGMVGLPTNDWGNKPLKPHKPLDLNFETSGETVKHIFTHFELELILHKAKVTNLLDFQFESRYFIKSMNDGASIGLPTVFKKAYSILKD